MIRFVFMLLVTITGLFAADLNEYLETAARNNLSLQAAYNNYQSSLERGNGAGYLPDPVLSGGLFIAPVETRLGPQQAKIAIKQKIPWPGTLSDEEKVYNASAQADLFAFYMQRDQLFYKIKTLYFAMSFKQHEMVLVKKQLANLATIRAIKETNFESAGGSMTALLFIDVKEQELQNRFLKLTDDLEVLKIDFNNLLNVSHTSEIEIDSSIPMPPADIVPFDSLSQTLNKIALFDSKITAGERKIDLNKQKNYPNITLGLEYVMIGERTDMDVKDNGRDALAGVVSLNLPIFRGRNNARVKEATYQKHVLENKRKDELNRIRSAYNKTVYALSDGRRRLSLYEQLLVKLERIIAIEDQNLYSSEGSLERIIGLYNQRYGYQLKEMKARKDLAEAYAYILFLTSSNQIEEQE